jgi:hypothetical protein
MFCTRGKFRFWDACRRARSPPKSRSLTIKPFGMTTFKCGARLQRATVWSSALAQIETQRRTFGARQGGRLEIEKRSYVWRSFLKEPFGSVLFPNRSPVAGTDLEGLITFLNIQMPDSDESCRIIRPASHTSALGLVFIAENGAGAQGGICGG